VQATGVRRARRRLSLVAALGAAAAAALAPPALAAGPQAGATELGAVPASQTIALVLPLKADLAGLRRQALAVTTPGLAQYGQYEPIPTLARRFGATAATRTRVTRYLAGVGATGVKVDATGLFADATMRVGLAQRLFGTPLARFRSAHDTRFIAPTANASVPAALRGLVTGVVGLDTRPVLASTPLTGASWAHTPAHAAAAPQISSAYAPQSGTAGGCAAARAIRGFTPNEYLTAYDYERLRQSGLAGQGERIALIEIDGFHPPDVRSFASCFRLPVPAINTFGVGLSKPLAPGPETTLDLEVLDATAPELKAIDVYESGSPVADLLTALAAPLQNPGDKPQVISVSLGVCEPGLLFAAGGPAGVEAAEGSLELAAASGITILAATGDAGSSACIGGSGPQDFTAVSYPASSWWATGVGGTNIVLNTANQIMTQRVWNDEPVGLGAGGGGPSGLFLRPPYQQGVVGPDVRSVPDVSMLADVEPGYDIYCTVKGDCTSPQHPDPWVPVGGTSAATPLLAGGIALVDQDLRLRGRQDVGLANPILYQLGRSGFGAAVFDDVTVGDDDLGRYLAGNGQPLGCCTATVGYDDASGWGGVDLAHFAQLATVLEPKIVAVALSLPGGQRPVAHRRLLATVACTGQCLMAAYAEVTIGRAAPFEVQSTVYLLRSRGHKTIGLALPGNDVRKLSSGLEHHARIIAVLHGVIVDPDGNVEKQTPGQRLPIRG
jgi:subtilase family serine protease